MKIEDILNHTSMYPIEFVVELSNIFPLTIDKMTKLHMGQLIVLWWSEMRHSLDGLMIWNFESLDNQYPITNHHFQSITGGLCLVWLTLIQPLLWVYSRDTLSIKGTTCSPEKNDIYCIIVTRRQGKNDGKEGFKSQWISQRFDLSAILFTQQPFCWECFFYFMFMILLQTTSLSLWYNSY